MAVDERLAQDISALQVALASQPDAVRFGELAQMLARSGRLPEALRAAERAVGLRPDLAEVHASYGRVLMVGGRLEEALQSFERACALGPGDVELLAGVAQSLVEAGQPQAAGPYLEQGLRLAPGDPRLASLRAMLDASAGGTPRPAPEPDEFLADGEEMVDLPAEAGGGPRASLDDLDDEVEPPTMFVENPLKQVRPAHEPEARPEQETRMDPDAGLRAEVSNAVNRVSRAARDAEPPTRLAEPIADEPAPWDRPWDAEPAPPARLSLPGDSAAPPTRAMPPPAPLPAPAGEGRGPAPATPSSSISYWKVFLVVVPLLLLAIVAGVWVGYRHIQDEKLADLLDQATGAISQDTMAGYTDARERLRELLEIQPAHPRGQALAALVAARLHDEYGPNLALREEAERLLAGDASGASHEQLAARLHLAGRPPPAELLERLRAAQQGAPSDPRLSGVLGEALLRADQPEAAKAQIEAALASLPSDLRLLDLRAEVAERAGDLAAALELAGRAQAIHGGHVHSLLRFSRLRLAHGKDLPRVEEDLGRLLQLPQVTDRNRATAHRLLAEVAFLVGERTRALSAVKAAAGLSPDDADFHLELAQLCLRFHALDEAAAHAARTLELRPEAVEARLLSLASLLPRDRAREALKGLDALVGQKVPKAPFLLLRGEALLASGNAAGAMADLGQVPENTAEHPRARALLGLAQLEAGDAEGARRSLQALLKQAPDLALAHLAMGRYREQKNLRQSAMASYQKAAELEPRCYQALAALGWLEHDARRPKQAEAWAAKALQANPYAVDALYLLGQLRLAAADSQPALEAFARALTERPDHAEALVGMAEALLDLGDLDKARLAVAKAKKLGMRDAHSLHVEGRVELASGRFHPAVRALLAASEAARGDAEILADLGLAQLGARSLTAAEKSLKDSLRRKRILRAQEGLGKLLSAKGQWRPAAQAYEAAAGLARRQSRPPTDVHRLYMLAARAMARDSAAGDRRWGSARRLFRLAAKTLPEDPESKYEVAVTFDRQDNLRGARQAYEAVLATQPDHAPSLFRLGLLEYDDRREARAKELLTKFLGITDKGPDAKRAREVLKRIK